MAAGALREVLTKADDWIMLAPDDTYREVTVRLWGKGVVLRREVKGAEIVASRRMAVRPQQFILSRIDARNGAFGIVPEDLDGAIVSNDFPAFTVSPGKLDPAYLKWLSKTSGFVELCKSASEGTTNRVRLKEERFLTSTIPLPPLPEQQRIVARIEQLSAKIEEARHLKQYTITEMEALFEASVGKIFSKYNDYPKAPLKALTSKIGSGSTPLGGRTAYPTTGF